MDWNDLTLRCLHFFVVTYVPSFWYNVWVKKSGLYSGSHVVGLTFEFRSEYNFFDKKIDAMYFGWKIRLKYCAKKWILVFLLYFPIFILLLWEKKFSSIFWKLKIRLCFDKKIERFYSLFLIRSMWIFAFTLKKIRAM